MIIESKIRIALTGMTIPYNGTGHTVAGTSEDRSLSFIQPLFASQQI